MKASIPVCALLATGQLPTTTAVGGDKKTKTVKGDTSLCTYCGIYCGACNIYSGDIALHAGELERILDSYGFTFRNAPEIGEAYPDFKRVLDYIIKRFTPGPTCRSACNSGLQDCPIRKCAEERSVETCAFCDEFPCEKLQVLEPEYGIVAELREQKEKSLQAWADKMAARVAAGWSYVDLLDPRD